MVGAFIIYQVVFVYLADWYVFPLFYLTTCELESPFVTVKLWSICVIRIGRPKHVSYVYRSVVMDTSISCSTSF